MSAPSQAPPAAAPAPAADARQELDQTVREFGRVWLGRALSEEEQRELSLCAAVFSAQAGGAAAAVRGETGDLVDQERQQIQDVIQQSLARAQAAVTRSARSGLAAEREVLGAVERASSLQDLMPGKPAAGAAAKPRPPTPMEQIAERLGELVRQEVQARFDSEIGPLARQLQDVIAAARANGVLPDQNNGSASADESRATAQDSASAVRPDRDNNFNDAAQANGQAASQGNR